MKTIQVTFLFALLATLVGGCKTDPKLAEQPDRAPASLDQESRIPEGFERTGGELVAWGTPLQELPWLTVISEFNNQIKAAPAGSSPTSPTANLPEVYTFENQFLREVRQRRLTELPEQEFASLLERYTNQFRSPPREKKAGLIGHTIYSWESPKTRVATFQRPWKQGFHEIITTWQSVR